MSTKTLQQIEKSFRRGFLTTGQEPIMRDLGGNVYDIDYLESGIIDAETGEVHEYDGTRPEKIVSYVGYLADDECEYPLEDWEWNLDMFPDCCYYRILRDGNNFVVETAGIGPHHDIDLS